MDLMLVALFAMQRDAANLQGVAQNLSNALTAGYKKQVLAPGAFAAQFDSAGRLQQVTSAVQAQPARFLDASAGTLRGTGIPTDVAIEGDGFFELAGAGGSVYTRRGEFRVDAAGRLLGPQGMAVVGTGGEIVLSGDPFQIGSNGDITQEGAVVARLKVVHFTHAESMEPLGAGSYGQGGAIAGDTADGMRLRAGYLENSNVDSAREMVNLTETVRHFEAMQKLVQGYDEVLEKSIRKLGEF